MEGLGALLFSPSREREFVKKCQMNNMRVQIGEQPHTHTHLTLRLTHTRSLHKRHAPKAPLQLACLCARTRALAGGDGEGV